MLPWWWRWRRIFACYSGYVHYKPSQAIGFPASRPSQAWASQPPGLPRPKTSQSNSRGLPYKTAVGAMARTWRMYPYSCPSRQISPSFCSHTQNLSQERALAPRQRVNKRSWKKRRDVYLITLGFSNTTSGQRCDLFKRFGRVRASNKSVKQR